MICCTEYDITMHKTSLAGLIILLNLVKRLITSGILTCLFFRYTNLALFLLYYIQCRFKGSNIYYAKSPENDKSTNDNEILGYYMLKNDVEI